MEKEPTDNNQKNHSFSCKKCNFKTSQEMTLKNISTWNMMKAPTLNQYLLSYTA
jgi:hypothetical protein